MKKSYSSHIDPLRSSSLTVQHKSTSSMNKPGHLQDFFSRTSYYKPSSFTFNSYSQKYNKTMKESDSNFSKTLIKNDRKQHSNQPNNSIKKTGIKSNLKKNLSSKETNPISERDFSNNERIPTNNEGNLMNNDKSLDIDMEGFLFQSPSSLHLKSSSCFKGSKAYTEAMKALQIKVKKLESENTQLRKNFDEFQGKIHEIVEQRITEKTNFFITLENNLKEKIMFLEGEKNSLEMTCFALRSDVSSLQEKLKIFEEKSNLDYKDFVREKSDLRKNLLKSHEKMKFLEEENQNLIKIREDVLKENKCISNSINNYENTFQLLQKQNEVLKVELHKSFHQSNKSMNEKPMKNLIEDKNEMKNKLEQREKEIDFIKEKFQDFLMKNELKILPKENENSHLHLKNSHNKYYFYLLYNILIFL